MAGETLRSPRSVGRTGVHARVPGSPGRALSQGRHRGALLRRRPVHALRHQEEARPSAAPRGLPERARQHQRPPGHRAPGNGVEPSAVFCTFVIEQLCVVCVC